MLSDKCIMLCTRAKSQLENICSLIETGDITLAQLSLLKENGENVDDLLKIAPKYEGELKRLLDQRFLEKDHFTNRLNLLKQLCLHINVEIEGIYT